MSKETLAKKHSGDSRFPNTGDSILRRDYIVQKILQGYRNFRTHCTRCTKTKVSQKL